MFSFKFYILYVYCYVFSFLGSGLGVKSETGVDDQKRGQQQKIIIEGLDSATVVGIAFAAFAIGILLMGALWFIHSHTGDYIML